MSDDWGIIGGGFGLYGYLPALAKMGAKSILIHEKHLHLMNLREELRGYFSIIHAVPSYEVLVNIVDSLIVSVPPQAQEIYILQNAGTRYKNLLLEKPLGINPISANRVFAKGVDIADKVRVGYAFLYTKWAQKIYSKFPAEKVNQINIVWKFDSHHHRNGLRSWKSNHNIGGGALRFYGIQLIAFIASFGELAEVKAPRLAIDDAGDAYEWTAELVLKNDLRITIQLNSQLPKNQFDVLVKASKETLVINLESPFDGELKCGIQDIRISALSSILETFKNDNLNDYYFYTNVNNIWNIIESKTDFYFMKY